MTVTLTTYPTALLNKIGSYVCQTIIYIQQQQPQLLLDKYRSISWRDNTNQSRLKTKLIEIISNAQDWDSLVNQVEVFIKALLVSDLTYTPVLIKLKEKIRELNPKISESKISSEEQDVSSTNKESDKQIIDATTSKIQKSEVEITEPNVSQNQQDTISSESNDKESVPETNQVDKEKQTSLQTNKEDVNAPEKTEQSQTKSQTEITVLLLDAENIKITPETEEFLGNFCENPIQIKIAFANWQSMGKKDVEFHQRGYDLIHVPHGKDNADGKMIAFGSEIDEYYPKIKEVLICSSDKIMTNLCNHLLQKGLTVYQVSQDNSNLTILNGKTHQTQNHTILPPIEKVISQIKEIIKEQEKQTSNQWIKLSQISQLFEDKYKFGLNKVVSHYLPGKTVKNIFVDKPEFVIHQIPEHPEIYITLFKMPTQNNIDSNQLTFENKSNLEKALIKIMTKLVGKTPNNYIPINTVGERFNKQHGKGITKILKELNINGNFVNFLQSCNSFELKKTGSIWQVGLK